MKNKLVLLLVVIAVFNAQFVLAQSCEWARGAGGSGNNVSKSVTTDVAGNLYITGYFESPTIIFDTILITNTSSYLSSDLFLVKYDSFGNVKWVRQAGGSEYDGANSVTTDALGNVYITGYFSSPVLSIGTIFLNNSGSGDIFIAKYDMLGNFIWAKSVSGSDDETANSVISDVAGNVYITGYYNSPTLTFDTITLINVGDYDIFLAKYDSQGNVIWAKSIGGNNFDNAKSVTIDTFGNIYLTGYFVSPTISFGTTILTKENYVDLFIAKYDTLGNIIWARNVDGGIAQSITTDFLGNIYITGFFNDKTLNFDTITLNNVGGNDIFLAKYDALGDIIWAKSAGGYDDDYAVSVTTDAFGKVYTTGNFGSLTINFGTNVLTNQGRRDIFITKYDSFGNVVWAKSASGSNIDVAQAVATYANGNIYITGAYSSPTLTFGISTFLADTIAGSSNVFLAKYHNNNTSIATIRQESTNLTLYPNPTNNNELKIFINSNTNVAAISIVDVLGREVYTQSNPLGNTTNNATTYDIVLPALPGGVYYLHAICSNSNECLPFVLSAK